MSITFGVLMLVLVSGEGVSGEVELLVRAPDGRPAVGAKVRVEVTRYPEPPDGVAGRMASAQADAAGVVRIAWPTGRSRLAVLVPGVGYGQTGLIDVAYGQPTRVTLPPLAPFAVLEGVLPADFRGEGTIVTIRGGMPWSEQRVSQDPAGRFRVEVTGGQWELKAADDRKRELVLPGPVTVVPGQTASGLALLPPKPRRIAETLEFGGDSRLKGGEGIWAAGTVRTPDGKPLAGARVWVYATYHGGIRMYETVKQTVADGGGRYEVRGEAGQSMFTASVVAHAPGRPPAWAWIGSPAEADPADFIGPPAPGQPPIVDFVVPDRGGRLNVTVEQNGKPAPGIAVGIALEGVNLKDRWALGGDTPQRSALSAVVHPVATTDAAGVARFDALLPGPLSGRRDTHRSEVCHQPIRLGVARFGIDSARLRPRRPGRSRANHHPPPRDSSPACRSPRARHWSGRLPLRRRERLIRVWQIRFRGWFPDDASACRRSGGT